MDNTPVVHGFSQRIDPRSLYSVAQVEAIQVVACVIAGISLVGSLVAVYWFARMKKKFRHNLIMILIVGDILRSSFLFIFPLISLVKGHIQTNTPFCQASGYLTQTGIEIADFAVLTIATHTLLQIVQPTISGYGTLDNGLYRYRVAVYVVAAILPASWTALAFIGKNGGFVSQGPTCSLPLRPYWYRLSISWIPRYVIMLVVLAMYTVIYVRVGRQNGTFSFFGLFKVNKPWETVIAPSKLSIHEPQQDGAEGTNNRRRFSRHKLRVDTGNNGNHIDAYGPTDPVHLNLPAHAHSRKVSDGTTLVSHGSLEFGHQKPLLITPQFEPNDPMAVVNFDGPTDSPSRKKSVLIRVSERLLKSPISPGGSTTPPVARPPEQQIIGKKIMTRHMRKRQDAIQRQLGLLFLYPVCYFVTYVPPFVAHGMNYSNYYVQHPVFGLNLFSFMCLASLGTVDAIVFSIRERPWRHIVGSDGTFWGSFRFWDNDGVRRTSDDSEVGNEMSATDPTHSVETPLHSAVPGSRRMSADRASRNSNASDNQRDSWITNMTFPINLGPNQNQPNRPRTTRVPSWSHFRTGSTVAAPILEEGDPSEFLHSAIPNSPNPLLNGVPGSAVSAPGVVDQHIRGERWGSTYSGMSLGSEDGIDRELANMDKWLDRAVQREWSGLQRKGSET